MDILSALITLFTSAVPAYNYVLENVRHVPRTENTLDSTLVIGWNLLDQIYSAQLQNRNIGNADNIEEATKILIQLCYEVEDVSDEQKLGNEYGYQSSILRQIGRKILKRLNIPEAMNRNLLRKLESERDNWNNILSAGTSQERTIFDSLLATARVGVNRYEECKEKIEKTVEHYNQELYARLPLGFSEPFARKCNGSLLGAELFGLFIAKCNEIQRQNIENNQNWWLNSEFKQIIEDQVRPNYIGMCSEKRRCFAYFSLFPLDHEFNIDDLVHLWVGECFVRLNGQTPISLKQIKELYADNLKERLILQLQRSGDFGLLYKLDNVSQYFAKLASGKTCLHLHQHVPSLDNNIRHLSSSCDIKKVWSQLKKSKLKLRTFLALYAENYSDQLEECTLKPLSAGSRLRVLSLTRTNVTELSTLISKLKRLRYLDVSSTKVTRLPSDLYQKNPALQFLKIKDTNLTKWPLENFHKLNNLIYVDWDDKFLRAKVLPPHIGNLIRLEKLPLFQISDTDGYFISELKGMNNLQGSICIENLELVTLDNADREASEAAKEKAMQAAKKAMLDEKIHLRSIVLQWNSQSIRGAACYEGVLAGLEPHSNVKELIIRNYGGDNFPDWMSRSVLEKIELKACRPDDISAFGKMKNLKTLVLTDMESKELSLRSAGDDETVACFPKLESIEFHNLAMLETWTGFKDGDFPRLTELKFAGCNLIGSHFPFIKKLKNSNPSIQVTVSYTNPLP